MPARLKTGIYLPDNESRLKPEYTCQIWQSRLKLEYTCQIWQSRLKTGICLPDMSLDLKE